MKKHLFLGISFMIISTFLMAQSGTLDHTFNTFDDGEVGYGFDNNIYTTLQQADGKILAGGSFNRYNGTETKRLIRLNLNGSVDHSFNIGTGFNGLVSSLAQQDDEKIVVGGNFTAFNDEQAYNIIRLNTDGSRDDTFNTGNGFNGEVFAIQIQPDEKILVGGVFTEYDGTERKRIIRLNTDGSIDITFNIGAGFDDAVSAIALQTDGKIIVGGDFTSYRNNNHNRIVRLTTNGSIDNSFSAGTGFNYRVYDIKLDLNEEILVGGAFTEYNGFITKNIARLHTNGAIDYPFTAGDGFDNAVYSISIVNDYIQNDYKLIVGGKFKKFRNGSIRKIISLNSNGSINSGFNVGAGILNTSSSNLEIVRTTLVFWADGNTEKLLIGGHFKGFKNEIKIHLACIDLDGSTDVEFNVGGGADQEVKAVAVHPDGKIIIGGLFTRYNNTPQKYLARLNEDGTIDNTFVLEPTLFSNLISSIVIQPDGKILVGGWLSWNTGGGTPYIKNILRLNQDGSVDDTFQVQEGFNEFVDAIALHDDGKILVSGNFTEYDGDNVERLVRLNTDGTIDYTFNIGSGPNSGVRTIAVQNDGKILVGGIFTEFDGNVANRIARLNQDGSVDNTFNPGVGTDSFVFSIDVFSNGKIAVAGNFTQFNNNNYNGLVLLNEDGSIDDSFDIGTGINGNIVEKVLFQPDGKLLIGGSFNNINGVENRSLARLNLDGSIDPLFHIEQGFKGFVYNLALQADDKILVVGDFESYNNVQKHRVARLNNCQAGVGTDVIATCHPYTWIDGQLYSQSNNTATHLIPGGSANGCDSLVTLNLTINDLDITTSISGNTITANNSNATYQWVDCNNNYAAIPGATGQSYTPTTSGNYAVQISENGCTTTSNCVNLTITGLAENELDHYLKVYPNPATATLHIDTRESTLLRIVNVLGGTVATHELKTGNNTIDVSHLAKGLYFLQTQEGSTMKFMKE